MTCNSISCSSSNLMPDNIKYFKEEIISEILEIPVQKPDMEIIKDILVWPEVVSTKLIETEVGKSNEGQYLSGYKLVVEIKLNQKVIYVADEKTQSVHGAHFENMKSMFIIIPEEIGGESACDLFRADKLQVVPYVESIKFRMLDNRRIHKCVMLLVNVLIC